jgi:hypothetical protein
VRVLWAIGFVDGVIAADHVDDLADSGLFGGVEYHFVLAHVNQELDVVCWLDAAAVHTSWDLDNLTYIKITVKL